MIDPRPFSYEYRKPRLNNPTFQSSNLYESLYHLRLPQKTDFLIKRDHEKHIQNHMRNNNNNKFNNFNQKKHYSSAIRQNPQNDYTSRDSQRYKSYEKSNYHQQNHQNLSSSQLIRSSIDKRQQNIQNVQQNQNTTRFHHMNYNKQQNSHNIKREIPGQLYGPSSSSRQQIKNNSGVHSNLSNYGQNLINGPSSTKNSKLDRFSIFQKQQMGYNIINCRPNQMQRSLRVFPKLTLENKLLQRGMYAKNN